MEWLALANDWCELALCVAGVFLLERYVFLTPALPENRQRILYAATVVVAGIAYGLFGKGVAIGSIVAFGGLNMALATDKSRIANFLLVFPVMGLLDGIVIPLMMAPPIALGITGVSNQIYCLVIYGIMGVLLLVFALAGKKWRRWFADIQPMRKLSTTETAILCITGVAMLFYSTIMNTQARSLDLELLSSVTGGASPEMQAFGNLFAYGMGATLIMTVVVIVLVMQGNRRAVSQQRLLQMQGNVIELMADLVESRDKNTGGHIKRTAAYVEIVANALKERGAFADILTKQYIDDMVVAAPLHDIGKIAVSDVILNKPGKLTDREFEIMKSHAAAGRDMLKQAESQLGDFPYIRIAIDMAGSHHEKYNGKGYPEGLAGEAIPLCARIMAVADVFDALTAKRCYKEAMPLNKAFSIIEQDAGTHFDPVVARAFLDSRDEISRAFEHLDS